MRESIVYYSLSVTTCASGSAVEHLLAKEGVAGSIPVSRSSHVKRHPLWMPFLHEKTRDDFEKSDSRVRFARFYERCADRTKLSAGSLLTSGHISDWMHSATARQPTNAKHLAVAHRVAASKRHAVGHRVADASLPRRGMRMAPRSDSFPTSIVVTLVSIHRDNDSK